MTNNTNPVVATRTGRTHFAGPVPTTPNNSYRTFCGSIIADSRGWSNRPLGTPVTCNICTKRAGK